MDYQYLESNEQLAAFCDTIKNAGYCVIDTEFVRDKTYYAVLALIQIATEKHMACIDPLAIDNFDPLVALLQNQDIIKVFHSPSQDLEILFQRFSCMPQPVFDTQLAAAVLGYDHQVGYADLVNQITGVKLDKKHTRANWSRRPLSLDEINYAMDDVRYLIPVYKTMATELAHKNRYPWIEDDLIAMTSISNYQSETADLWRRLKGVQKLKGVELQIARHLCQWREQMAQQKNLPRRWVVKDDLIIEIARLKPAKIADLDSIRDINERFIDKHGNRLLGIVATAQNSSRSDWPQHDVKQSLSTPQQALGDCLMALCRIIAQDNQIAVAALTTRRDIDNLITDRKNSRLSQGWRFSVAGEKLLDFIYGQSVLSVNNKRIQLSPRD
jgi:ribonuclease D